MPMQDQMILVKIFTQSHGHIMAVRDEATDKRHPVYFKRKDNTDDLTEHENG